MARPDSAAESTHNRTRPGRSPYVPPQHRGTDNQTRSARYNSNRNSHFNRSIPPRPGRTVSFHGRGRGRGSWYVRQLQNEGPHDAPDGFGELVAAQDSEDINFHAYEDIPVESSGSDIPQPVDSFADIDLGDALNENIKRCKYVKPTPVQRHAIPIAVSGRDLMACAQTGSGKTAAFCFPILSGILKGGFPSRGGRLACPSALILSPTRELACQIYEEAKKFAYQTRIKIVVAYGGTPIYRQFRELERGVDVLVATPGRLVDMIERSRVSLGMIRYLALDEADRMLDMGFEHQIRKIVEEMDMPSPGERQTMLFSATFPDQIQRLASDFLSNYIFLSVGRVGSSTGLIEQRVVYVQDMDKRNYLVDLLCSQNGKFVLTLVFVETKRGADALEQWLSVNGFPAIAIHGDKVQFERERALKSFKNGATPILVATDVASRGLDIPRVAHVVNFDLPKGIDDYVHRIGRTGRAGKSGLATAFFTKKDHTLAKALVGLMQEAKQEVPGWLSKYVENSGSAGRAWHHGGSKFGGYDVRTFEPEGLKTCHRSNYGIENPAGSNNFHASADDDDAANSGVVKPYNTGASGNWICDEPTIAYGWE